MIPLGVLALALALSAAGALAGALLGSYLGRAAALDARVEPLRASIEALADQVIHATRRWNKRDRDAAAAEDPATERQAKLAAITRRWQRTRG